MAKKRRQLARTKHYRYMKDAGKPANPGWTPLPNRIELERLVIHNSLKELKERIA